jgi:uncharacterized protein YcnI
MRTLLTTIVVVLAIASVSAHIMVSPPDSKAGVTQKYELRVHNEEKIATAEVVLDIPSAITVLSIGTAPAGSYTTSKAGDRIAHLTWKVAVQPGKYVALPFTAKNPETAQEVRWVVRATFSDGSTVEWSDKPGAAEKASVTKIAG